MRGASRTMTCRSDVSAIELLVTRLHCASRFSVAFRTRHGMPAPAQDKEKEIAFFDRHAAADDYDVFTPQSSARLVDFVSLSTGVRARRLCRIASASPQSNRPRNFARS